MKVLRRLLAAFVKARRERLLREYRQALDDMDWQYLFARNRATFVEGERRCRRALSLQMRVDPDGDIWMARQEAQRFGAPRPVYRVPQQ